MSKENNHSSKELHRLRDMLDSNDAQTRTQAVKRIISLMRAGENVGMVFSSMLRCVKTDDISLKRLVYLYLVNYSQQESEQSIMAVASFIKDAQDFNPLIRALAIRTMSRIQVESVAENLIIPLKQGLNDKDPYVRKTAAIAIAKIYNIIPDSIEDSGLFDCLINLLHDSNPLVIANTAIAIQEIGEARGTPIYTFTTETLTPLVSALSNSSEWCQTMILDTLSKWEPNSSEEASQMIDRLLPFLRNSNPAVVIGAFKVIFQLIDFDDRDPGSIFTQIIPPFMSLVSSQSSEIQYVVLRTLSLFCIKYPKALSKEINVFFCKYNDQSYIKMEKLDIIVTICTSSTVRIVLDEFREYCNAVDDRFVRKTIKSIGQIAIKIPSCSKSAMDLLVHLVDSKAIYSVEESIIVITELLRRFPGQFEAVIEKICNHSDEIKSPSAKSALIWIFGEYSGIIDHVDDLIDPYLDTFYDEDPMVQQILLSTITKIYLKNPDQVKDQLQFILQEATSTNKLILPDVRNRAIFYWRLLSIDTDLEFSKKMLMFNKKIDENFHQHSKYDPEILSELISNVGMVSGVLHQVPANFASSRKKDKNLLNFEDIQIIKGSNDIISLRGAWNKNGFSLEITNNSQNIIKDLALALNNNGCGLIIAQNPIFPNNGTIQIDSNIIVEIPLSIDPNKAKSDMSKSSLEFALRTNLGVIFFKQIVNIISLITPIQMKRREFLSLFEKKNSEVKIFITGEFAKTEVLEKRGIKVIARKEDEICIALLLPGNRIYIGDFEISRNEITGVIKGDPALLGLIEECARTAFCSNDI